MRRAHGQKFRAFCIYSTIRTLRRQDHNGAGTHCQSLRLPGSHMYRGRIQLFGKTVGSGLAAHVEKSGFLPVDVPPPYFIPFISWRRKCQGPPSNTPLFLHMTAYGYQFGAPAFSRAVERNFWLPSSGMGTQHNISTLSTRVGLPYRPTSAR